VRMGLRVTKTMGMYGAKTCAASAHPIAAGSGLGRQVNFKS